MFSIKLWFFKHKQYSLTLNKYFCLHLLDAFDEIFMYQILTDIQAGKTCNIPVYNYKTNSR